MPDRAHRRFHGHSINLSRRGCPLHGLHAVAGIPRFCSIFALLKCRKHRLLSLHYNKGRGDSSRIPGLSNFSKMDITKLKGEDLFLFLTTRIEDKEYSSVVELLPYAVPDSAKMYAILEKSVKEGRKFIAVYPMFGETPSSEMQLIGSIPDGALYLQ